MQELRGTWALTRFAARHDRVRILVWVGSLVLLVVLTASSTKGIYPTQHDLDQAAAVTEDNAAAIAFNGPAQGLDTIGGQVAFQVGAFGLTLVGLMTLLMMSRLTRGEEESGRMELVRSMPVGRHASTASAVLVVTAMNVAVGTLSALSLVALDLPVAGSIAFGLSFFVMGLAFVGITAVTAQVTENTRVASGLAGAVLGAAFVLRAVGDIGDGTVSWLSPIGWAQKVRPYAGEAWWALAVPVVAGAALFAAAGALASRRDFGGGLVAPRPGPPTAAPGLGRPVGLALRLLRGTTSWWSVGQLLTGLAYGSIAESIDDFVSDNEAMRDLLARTGTADLTDAYLGTATLFLALVAGGYAVQAALRPRGEEVGLRAEPVLAAGVSRPRWLGSQLTVAALGSAVVLASGGLGTGTVYALMVGDAGQVPRLVGASLAYLPAMWLLIALTTLLSGAVPRRAPLAWAVVAACFVIGLLGQLLDIPRWLADLSPFERTPQLPAADLDALPLVVLTALAAAVLALGMAAFRRRDISP